MSASGIHRMQGIDLGDEAIVMGTFNKALDYHSGMFLDLYWRAESTLRSSVRLVVIGYGFSDQALNASLIGWMLRCPSARMYICDADPTTMLARSRPAANNSLCYWLERGRVVLDARSAETVPESEVLHEFLSAGNPS